MVKVKKIQDRFYHAFHSRKRDTFSIIFYEDIRTHFAGRNAYIVTSAPIELKKKYPDEYAFLDDILKYINSGVKVKYFIDKDCAEAYLRGEQWR